MYHVSTQGIDEHIINEIIIINIIIIIIIVVVVINVNSNNILQFSVTGWFSHLYQASCCSKCFRQINNKNKN